MINHCRTTYLFFFVFITFSTHIYAQTVQWQNTIGGSNNEWLFSTELANDGNYILSGYSYSDTSGDKTENTKGNNDYWILKLDDATGGIIWQKTIGGNATEYATSTKQTKDGGYIIGGYSASNSSGDKTENSRGGDDYWVVRLDAARNIVWDKTFGGSGTDRLWSIIETQDGGFLMGGESDSNISGDKTENARGLKDMWVIKIAPDGTEEWQKTYGGTDIDILKSIVSSNDGNFILAGFSSSNISGEKTENSRGLQDYWVLKIDATGNIIWQKTYGGNNGDSAYFIQTTSDGNFVVGGESASNISGEKTENSFCNSTDAWVIKIDTNGQLIWDKTIGGNDTEFFGNIRETNDNGFILGMASFSQNTGYKTEASYGNRDYWVVKLNETGNLEWDKSFGGNNIDNLTTVLQTNDGSYTVGGWSASNASGNKTENSNGLWDYWMLKFQMDADDYNPPTSTTTAVCSGSNLELTATTGVYYNWTGPNGFTSSVQNPVISNVSSINAGTYNVTISDNSNCSETKIINVTVTASTTITPISDITICDDDEDGFAIFNLTPIKSNLLLDPNNISVDFYDENGDRIPDTELPTYKNKISNQEVIKVEVNNTSSSCSKKTTFKLIVSTIIANSMPDIIGCDTDTNNISEFFDTSTVETTVLAGQTNVTVTYTNNNGDILPSPLPNPYTNKYLNEEITVRVSSNTDPGCYKETSFKLITNPCTDLSLDYPPFFTPNNDGINDFWPRKISAESISIYNRYGKLLKVLYPGSPKWNGTYNGKQLPSTDYWFLAIFTDEKPIKGHFSLKR